jgi:hypothetical protein
MTMELKHAGVLLLVVLMSVCSGSAKVIYVDDDATRANDGTSWENAYKYLQDALADANSAEKPVEIRVAQGIYKPDQGASQTTGDRESAFHLVNGVSIKGGYAGFDEPDPDARDIVRYETVLSGDLNADDPELENWQWQTIDDLVRGPSRKDNCYTVVNGSGTDQTAVLDGFAVMAGHGNVSAWYGERESPAPDTDAVCIDHSPATLSDGCDEDSADPEHNGGGMYNNAASPTVVDCTFRLNSTCSERLGGGAGMFNFNSRPTLHKCSFVENIAFGANATSQGGGILNIDSDPTLVGCVFERNMATGFDAEYYGAGMANIRSNPTLTDCSFIENSAEYSAGGAIANDEGSNMSLTHCTFSGNKAECGGAISNGESRPMLLRCTFIGNSASNFGGGMLTGGSPTLVGCTFKGNTATEGGGIWTDFRSSVTLKDCTFSDNKASSGGGMYNGGASYNDPNGRTVISSCTFTANSAYQGGGMYSAWNRKTAVIACAFTGNSATEGGGGIYYCGSEQTLTNCTFAGNSAAKGDALSCDSCGPTQPSNLRAVNCILWNGGGQIFNADGSTVNITYSDIQGRWPGEGNIDADPSFSDPGRWVSQNDPNQIVEPNDVNGIWIDGDYHLKSQAGRWDAETQSWVKDDVTSPCIDAGDPMSPIGYEPFPNGGRINMGAYGGTGEASKSYFGEPVCETIIAGDINGDCKVDFADFAVMALHWLEDNSF